MPYVDQKSRNKFLTGFDLTTLAMNIKTPGELNYVITRLVDQWVGDEGKNYQNINSAVGVLECAKLEFYRRLAGPYEDTKIEQNGDVYNNV